MFYFFKIISYNIIGDNMKIRKRKDIFDEMEEEKEINIKNDESQEKNEEKKLDEIIKEEIKKEKIEIKIDNELYGNKITFFKIFIIILSIILLAISGYNLYLNINKTDNIDLNYLIINNSILVGISIFSLFMCIFKNNIEKFFKTLLIFSLIGYISFNILVDKNIIKIEKQKLMPNLVGMTYQEVKNWADENNITLDLNYEYSDTYKENEIINQDISQEILLKKVKNVKLTISAGPNYDKTIVLSNMNGWNIDDAIEIINQNFLNNVEIQYVKNNDYEKDIIINQNIKGNIRRNDKLILTVSLGNSVDKIPMIDVKDKSLFDLELWLKRNDIKYNIEYVYSDQVKRNDIISVNKEKDDEIDTKNDKLNIIVSKGKSIKVPNILEMSIEEVTNWITDNNLKVNYEDKYDSNVALGGIIECNYKENDEIEEETLIKITTSKGPLKMESFTSLNDFRSWAEKYKVKYREEYQYNDNVSKGKIIKFSINQGATIQNNETITVYISNGKAIKIPNFIGKSKTESDKLCNNLGLRCSYTYGSYSSSAKDTVTAQNKKANTTVISGTSVTLTLSKGPAKSCTIYIQPTWYANNADGTISALKNKLPNELKNKGCTDVTFNYSKRCYNSIPAGYIANDSPIKGGNNTFTDGKTYTIYISDTNSCN